MQTRAPYAPRASLLAFALLAASTVAAGAQTLEWRFDNVTDFNSNIVRNRSGSTAYNGTLLGGHTQTRGALGNAADFNGSNGYLRASGTTGLRFPSGMTVEAFVRRDSNHSEDGVVSKWYGGDQFLLTFYPTGHGRLQFGIRDGANRYGSLYYDFPDSVYLGEWIHVAATYNGSGRLRLYVDGTLVASANRTVNGMAYGGRPIQAGDSGNSWSRFDGAIDEVKVWNYERSPGQLDHPLRPRVLVVEYDSTNPTYNNPHVISDGMIDDIRSSSQFVEFEIAQWVNTGSLPPQRSGGGFDYAGLYSTYNVCARAGRGEIHEVWVWAGPDGGMLEWAVNGPRREAYGLGVGMPACTVQTVTMGFNYERNLPEALHSMGHRLENNFRHFWGSYWNAFDGQYHRYGVTTQPPIQINDNHCGNIHFPPNADAHYEYDSGDWIRSNCPTWRSDGGGSYPWINCNAWGCNEEGFLNWWMSEAPGPSNNHGPGGSRLENWWTTLVQ